MQKTMPAAVWAVDERLIAPRYLMQISAQLAFSCTKRTVGFVSTCRHTLDAPQSESYLLKSFCPQKI